MVDILLCVYTLTSSPFIPLLPFINSKKKTPQMKNTTKFEKVVSSKCLLNKVSKKESYIGRIQRKKHKPKQRKKTPAMYILLPAIIYGER